jgi:hypothetical protein
MNFKNNAIREVQELIKLFPEYTLGEIIYAFLRNADIKKMSDLLSKEDEELFTAIEKTKTVENETA